ncbi:ATP-binding cassette domain-containing protein [Aciditerrimonas ferrireducens]|nr:ATP-binding cassette domain-containing protein [Aciditerrimonas ferrireducens]MCK4177325.1 ATP-binding cassette domain-containing protein [Aciditerrimonas ferrireducens]
MAGPSGAPEPALVAPGGAGPRSLLGSPPADLPDPAEAAVWVRDLTRRFSSFEAVRGIRFAVAPGETFGFLGPNGAGKSTTIAMLCTLLRPTSGTALVGGYDVVAARAEVRRRIGLVFQDTTLDDYLTAEENLRFHAELYGLPRRQAAERLDAVLAMVGLADRRRSIVRTFSGGMKRRLEIARGLLHSPRVLFLDEPTVGLDPQTRAHIWEYVDQLRQAEAITMFLTTHYMDEAEHCDRIAIVDQGRIVVMDTPEALKASVGQDRVEIQTADDARAAEALAERFGIQAARGGEGLTFHVAGGESFVPRLFAELPVAIASVRIARPTLDDVFMAYTGRSIRDAEASAGERLGASPWIRARRR